jgi:NAD(P)-dependent dehydrogenase (short-subunit alcohol dehydrogenase family)
MKSQVDLSGKSIMVTGATSGIGEVTARELAQRGAEVILVSRNPAKCRRKTEQIQAETGNPRVSYLAADLSSQEQIRNLVQSFQEKFAQLDVLVNNAGGFFWERRESGDGIEMTLALNHLNYFLLTHLLLDSLLSSPEPRIVNVSSDAHRGHQLDFEDLELENGYSANKAYGRSKLANLYFTYELDRRLADRKITVNALHPGFVATNFAREGRSLLRYLMPVVQLFARSPEKGAQTSLYLAGSPEVSGVSGKYFVDREAVRSSPVSYDREAARRLWEISQEMTGLG